MFVVSVVDQDLAVFHMDYCAYWLHILKIQISVFICWKKHTVCCILQEVLAFYTNSLICGYNYIFCVFSSWILYGNEVNKKHADFPVFAHVLFFVWIDIPIIEFAFLTTERYISSCCFLKVHSFYGIYLICGFAYILCFISLSVHIMCCFFQEVLRTPAWGRTHSPRYYWSRKVTGPSWTVSMITQHSSNGTIQTGYYRTALGKNLTPTTHLVLDMYRKHWVGWFNYRMSYMWVYSYLMKISILIYTHISFLQEY